MIDVVPNNMAYEGPGQDTNYSMYTPFNDKSYFHPFCYITNYGNWTDAQQVCVHLGTVWFDANVEYSAGSEATYCRYQISTRKARK